MEGKKRKRKPPNKKAAHCFGDRTAENKLQMKYYNNSQTKSSLKLFLGEALLFGNKDGKDFWPFFEVELKQFYEMKSLGDLT